MPELIDDKKTGFLVNTVDEAVESLKKIESIHRKNCREWAFSNFSLEKMTDGYIDVYKQIIQDKKN